MRGWLTRRIGPIIVGIAVAQALVALARPAAAFGPLANGEIADHLPDGWRELAQNHRAAFDTGANFPDYSSADDVPDWLKRVYQGFRPQDKFRKPTADSHSLALLLDLMQSATTAGEAAFALGALCNLTGDMVLRHFYAPMRMAEFGGPLTRSDSARLIVEAMTETALADSRTRMLGSLRKRDIGLFQLWYRVAKRHGERLGIEDFTSDVGLHEIALEMKMTAAAPGGTLASAIRALSLVTPADSGLYDRLTYGDVAQYLRLAGAAAASLAAEGFDSPWVTNGWGRDSNPYPQLAGSMHDPLRSGQKSRMPGWMRTPNPGVSIVDAYFVDADGQRVDRAPPSACVPANADSGPRQFRAVLRLAAIRPLDTQLALVVKRDIEHGRDPEVATAVQSLQFTASDVAAGVVRDYAVPFSFTPDDGPFRDSGDRPWARGFYLVARVPLRAGNDDPDAPPLALTFFTTFTPRSQEMVGFHSYNVWPFSLRVADDVPRNSCTRRGGFGDGKSNQPPPAGFAASRPAGFRYTCPFELVAGEPREVRVSAPGDRDLVGTLQLVPGATRGVVLLHEHTGGRGNWQRLQQQLVRAGVSSLAIDFRGRGLSGTMDDRSAWLERKPELIAALPQDALAAAHLLAAETGLPAARIALLGAGLGGNVAIRLAGALPEIPAVGALSPEPPADLDTQAIAALGQRPLLLVFAAEDAADAAAVAACKTLAQRATVLATPLDRLRGRGTRGLDRHEPLAAQLIDWLQKATATAK